MAFADFYRQSRDQCLRAVLATTGDLTLAEDLVAEGFARAWASWSKVSRHPAPAAWVVRTALNLRISWWRRYRREVVLDGHDRAQPVDEGADHVLLAAVRRLPRRQREVVVLRIWLDLDTRTVAEVLGISAATVGVHLSRATAHLRAGFADGSVELTLDYRKILDPATLEKALAGAGIPAVVKADVLCTPQGNELPETRQVFVVKKVVEDESSRYDLVINPSKMPAGSIVYFSVFPIHKGDGYAKAAQFLVPKDAQMNCRTVA
ncbi:SigE family RNA polymerase sigma factor [Dactylosporangium vinaceum]|uniref:SigE family RNA polymerase sigma factor n=1 Tax=Dactylosporangium vinaceum TaxID=53362 RepID=A0ABV5MHK9_9ACTN|nr:SigE family RNA polymerase sigma factor [Dactylosporangium vinaceum]